MEAPATTTSTTPAAAPGTVPPPLAPRSAWVALVLGWVLPGLGQIYVGRFLKGFLMMVTIGGLFYAGLVMTGFTCVNPYTYELEFVAHALLGGPTALAYWMSRGNVLEDPLPYFEAGRLYASVAGLLNVVAICDALGEVITHNEVARARALDRQAFQATIASQEGSHLHAEEERLRLATALDPSPPEGGFGLADLSAPAVSMPPLREQDGGEADDREGGS